MELEAGPVDVFDQKERRSTVEQRTEILKPVLEALDEDVVVDRLIDRDLVFLHHLDHRVVDLALFDVGNVVLFELFTLFEIRH